jgi:hypothetical protein
MGLSWQECWYKQRRAYSIIGFRMNWYKGYKENKHFPVKEGMALPYEYPHNWQSGLGSIDKHMPFEIAEREKKKHPDISYLGSGSRGLVSDIGGGKAIKYTISLEEAGRAKFFMEHPGEYPVVRIYGIEEIYANNTLYAITMEKVEPLDRRLWQCFDSVMQYVKHAPHDEDIYRKVMEYLGQYYMEQGVSKDEIKWLSVECKRLLVLETWGLLWDCYGRNVATNKEGHLVLVDLG